MYIYGAQLQAKPGKGAEAGVALPTLRDAIASAAGRPIWAWSVAAGAPIGSFTLSTRLDGTADLLEMQAKMGADENFQELAAASADLWASAPETTMAQVVATAGEIGETPAPVISITQSTIKSGNIGAALAWGTQVLEHVSNVTGLSGMMATAAAGNFFNLNWIFGAESGAATDAANAALAADPSYIELIDGAGGLFVEGSAQRALLVQMP